MNPLVLCRSGSRCASAARLNPPRPRVGLFAAAAGPAPAASLPARSMYVPSSVAPGSPAIRELQQRLASGKHAHFEQLLLTSLAAAKENASERLQPALYHALTWPTTTSEYLDYVRDYARWIPHPSEERCWVDPDTAGGDSQPAHSQELFQRVLHFYYLVDQPVSLGAAGAGASAIESGPVVVESTAWFSEWLVRFAREWGEHLDAPGTFTPDVLEAFRRYSPKYRVEDSMVPDPLRPGQLKPNNPGGWLSYNQFFARELNPGLRPIAAPHSNTVVTAPADCSYQGHCKIDENGCIPRVTLKGTHTYSRISDLLAGSAYRDCYANGTFVHYFLSAFSYHRYHTPVSGVVLESFPVLGKAFVAVTIKDNGHFDAPNSSSDGYEFEQARGVLVLDTRDSPLGNMGIVTVVPVGMAKVSSVNMTAQTGCTLAKGASFGYFLFGGSDIIVLFQDGVVPEKHVDVGSHYRHYGTPILTHGQGSR